MDSKPWSWNHDFSHLVCICKQENNQNIIDHTQSKLLTILDLQMFQRRVKGSSPSTKTQALPPYKILILYIILTVYHALHV